MHCSSDANPSAIDNWDVRTEHTVCDLDLLVHSALSRWYSRASCSLPERRLPLHGQWETSGRSPAFLENRQILHLAAMR